MAKSWRDFAASTRDNSDDSDKSPPIVPNVTNVTGLPSDMLQGLLRLRSMAVPRWCDPERWAMVRDDAERLSRDGWASFAVELGWSALDLFGAATDPASDPRADGLASWLAGRKLRAVSTDFAVVVDDTGGRHYFNRPREAGARLLWELGGAEVLPFRSGGK